MLNLASMLKDRGLDLNDPTVKYARKQKLVFGGVPSARKDIPEKSLGKNEDGYTRTQSQAREIVSKVFQVRSEFSRHEEKRELLKIALRRARRQSQISPLADDLSAVDPFQTA